jgi:ssDNA-binding Zn-finger/Zn-ribbon topoisomerase 1
MSGPDPGPAPHRPVRGAPDPCPACGGALVQREGRRGPFYGCARYPSCRFTASLDPTTGRPQLRLSQQRGIPCPEPGCSSELRLIEGRRGPFYGCTRYPACKGQRGARKDGSPLPIFRPGAQVEAAFQKDRQRRLRQLRRDMRID